MGPQLLGVEQGNGALTSDLGRREFCPPPPEGNSQASPQGASSVNPFLARLQNHSSKAFATRSKLFLISHGIC